MEHRETGYESRAWEFPSLESRSGFETAVKSLERQGAFDAFRPDEVDDQDLKYGEGLAYTLEDVDDLLDGSFEFVKRYRITSPVKTPVARNPRGFLASAVRPQVQGEVYVIDTVKGASVLGDAPIVEYVEEKVTGEEKGIVERIREL